MWEKWWNMKHKCQFEMIQTEAIGIYEKQEGQDNKFSCEGNVYQCRCKKAILVPYDSNLRIVEIETPPRSGSASKRRES